VTQSTHVEFSEQERILLLDALEILSPDGSEEQDALEILTQRVIGFSEEAGDVQIDLTEVDVQLIIDAMDVVDPDDFEMQDLAGDLSDRLRQEIQIFDQGTPDI
ncbi:unnamed protein product, partial [Laminaria digitata]